MKNKVIAGITAVIMLCGISAGTICLTGCGSHAAVNASADSETPAADNISWELNAGTLTVSGSGAIEDFEYDEEDGKVSPRTGNSEITKVIIGDGVTRIGNLAFCGCEGLTEIEIADSVKSIGYAAFAECTALESVEIPGSVEYLDEHAFGGIMHLTFAL